MKEVIFKGIVKIKEDLTTENLILRDQEVDHTTEEVKDQETDQEISQETEVGIDQETDQEIDQ
jgi:hypothetical protein